jgi:hypothetical protein
VAEALYFSARLRLSKENTDTQVHSLTKSVQNSGCLQDMKTTCAVTSKYTHLDNLPGAHDLQVRRHVEEVMKVVELDVLRDSLVGVPGQSGLSVEARKRLSIAVEQASSGCCTATHFTGGYCALV